jgi:hypothetical protein
MLAQRQQEGKVIGILDHLAASAPPTYLQRRSVSVRSVKVCTKDPGVLFNPLCIEHLITISVPVYRHGCLLLQCFVSAVLANRVCSCVLAPLHHRSTSDVGGVLTVVGPGICGCREGKEVPDVIKEIETRYPIVEAVPLNRGCAYSHYVEVVPSGISKDAVAFVLQHSQNVFDRGLLHGQCPPLLIYCAGDLGPLVDCEMTSIEVTNQQRGLLRPLNTYVGRRN